MGVNGSGLWDASSRGGTACLLGLSAVVALLAWAGESRAGPVILAAPSGPMGNQSTLPAFTTVMSGDLSATIATVQPPIGAVNRSDSLAVGPVTAPSTLTNAATPFGGSQSGGAIGYGYGASLSVAPLAPMNGIYQYDLRLSAFAATGINTPGASLSADVTSSVALRFQPDTPGVPLDLAYTVGAAPGARVQSNPDGSISLTNTLNASASGNASTGTLTRNEIVTLWPTGLVESILRDSVHVSAVYAGGTDANSRPLLVGSFQPMNVSLQEAARLLGFDHFNWIQSKTHLPVGWTGSIVDASNLPVATMNIAPNGDLLSVSGRVTQYYDPIPVTSLRYQLGNGAGTQFTVHKETGSNDALPFYYGEDRTASSNMWNLYFPGDSNRPPTLATNSLRFEDAPLVPNSMHLQPGEYQEFYTRLVGVTASGEQVDLPTGLGLGFHWKTDGVNLGANLASPDPNGHVFDLFYEIGPGMFDSQAMISGGVFDIVMDNQVVAITEPGTLALLSLSLAAVALRRRR